MASRPPRNRRSRYSSRYRARRSREPRGPRKMAERLADRRSRREPREGSRAAAHPLLQPVCGGGGSQLCIHRPPRAHIWKVFPSRGLLEGFWEVTPGSGWDRGLRAPRPAQPTQRPAPFPSTPWPPDLQLTSPSPGPSVLCRLLKEDGPTNRT